MARNRKRGRSKNSTENENGAVDEAQQSAGEDASSGEPPPAGHNSSDRKRIMVEVAGELILLEGQMEVIRGHMKDARGKLKSLGIKAAEFNTVLRLRKLEDGDRNEALDQLRECFEALLPGQQGSLFGDLEQQPAGDPKAAYDAGAAAGAKGKAAGSNPYPLGTEDHDQWQWGWEEEQKRLAGDVGTGAEPATAGA